MLRTRMDVARDVLVGEKMREMTKCFEKTVQRILKERKMILQV